MSKNISVTVYLYNGTDSKLKAFATLTVYSPALDCDIVIKNFTVRSGKNGVFVSFPSHYDKKNKEYRDDVFPLSAEGRKTISDIIMKAYDIQVNKAEQTAIDGFRR